MLVRPGMSESPSTVKVTPPVNRRSSLGFGADDEDDDVPELGGAGGWSAARLVELAGLRRNIHIKWRTRSPLQVSSDNPPGRCSIQQISLTSIILYGLYPESGTPLLVVHRSVRLEASPVSKASRISERHSYLNALLYRKASVGLSCEARLAGSIPKTTPTATETPKATNTDVTEMGT